MSHVHAELSSAQYDVFLCHNSKDKDAVRALNEILRQEFNLRTFLDESAIVGGDAWKQPISRALENSKSCALILGPNGWGGYQLEGEAIPALERHNRDPGFRIVPVFLPGTDLLSLALLQLESFINQTHWIEFKNGVHDRVAILTLVAALKGVNAFPEGRPEITVTRVRFDAIRWDASARKNSSILYGGLQLYEARALAHQRGAELGDLAHEFLSECERRQNELMGRTLAAHAGALSRNPRQMEFAANLALESVARFATPEAHAVLREANATLPLPIAELHHSSAVTLVLMTADGSRIITGSKGGTVAFWDARTHERVASDEQGAPITGPSGSYLLASSAFAGHSDQLSLWSASEWELRWRQGMVMDAAFGATGEQVVTAWGSAIGIRSTSNGKPLGHYLLGAQVTSIDAHPRNSQISAVTFDRQLWLGDRTTGVSSILNGVSPVTAVRFSPCGRWVAALGDDFKLYVIALQQSRAFTIPFEGLVGTNFVFSQQGNLLAVLPPERRSISVWALPSARCVCITSVSEPSAVCFSPDEKQLIVADDQDCARVFHLPAGDDALWSAGIGVAMSLSFAEDGKELVWWGAIPKAGYQIELDARTFVTLDAETGRRISAKDSSPSEVDTSLPKLTELLARPAVAEACEKRGFVRATASRDRRWLGICHEHQMVSVWDMASVSEVFAFSMPSPVSAMTFAPRGDLFASGDEYGGISVWRSSGQELARFSHQEPITQLAFSPDGSSLAAASADGTLRMWSVDPRRLAERVSAKLRRRLSQEEWQAYLGDEPALSGVAQAATRPRASSSAAAGSAPSPAGWP